MKYTWLLILLLFQCSPTKEEPCPSKKCSDYSAQQAAQADFDKNQRCLSSLDADNDGIACEELLNNSGTGCPATANCGCSGKAKAVCESTCCKWEVGTGCICK